MQLLIDGQDVCPEWLETASEEMPIASVCDRIAVDLRQRDRYAISVTAHDVIAGVIETDGIDEDMGDYYATVGDVTLLEITTESISEAEAGIERDVSELLALAIVHCRAAAKQIEDDDEDADITVMDAMESVRAILEGVSALQLLRDLEPAKLLDAETVAEAAESIGSAESRYTVADGCRTIADVLQRWAI